MSTIFKCVIGAWFIFCTLNVAAMDKSDTKKWSDDIDAMHAGLRAGHINLYHRISEREFTAELDAIKGNLKSLTPLQAEMAIWRALHMVGGGVSDGHTSVLLDFRRYQWLPVRFALYGEEVRIVGATAEYHELLGSRVVQIGGVQIVEVLDKLSTVAQFTENLQSERFFLTTILRCANVLHGLNVTESSDRTEVTVMKSDGTQQSASLKNGTHAITRNVENGYPTLNPNVTRPESAFSSSLWFTAIESLAAVYIKFDRYPEFDAMEEFGNTLASHIQENNSRNVIIDLRENFGGNGFIGHRLAAAILDENSIDWRNGVYVLTGAQTYSAAMMNAVEFRQVLNARIVGEPTGGNPVGYQDADRLKLPNSGLIISYSKRLYRMQDVPTNGVQPDVYIPVRWSDRKAGYDAALDWVVKDMQSRSVTE